MSQRVLYYSFAHKINHPRTSLWLCNVITSRQSAPSCCRALSMHLSTPGNKIPVQDTLSSSKDRGDIPRSPNIFKRGVPLPVEVIQKLIQNLSKVDKKTERAAYSTLIEGNSHRLDVLEQIYEVAKFECQSRHIRHIVTLIAGRLILIGDAKVGVDIFLEDRGINSKAPELIDILSRRKRLDLVLKIVEKKEAFLPHYIEKLAESDYIAAEKLSQDPKLSNFSPLNFLKSARHESDLVRFWTGASRPLKRQFGTYLIAIWGKLFPDDLLNIHSGQSWNDDKYPLLKEFLFDKDGQVVFSDLFKQLMTWRLLIEGYLLQNNTSQADKVLSLAIEQIPNLQEDALLELYEPFLDYYYKKRDYPSLQSTTQKIVTRMSQKKFTFYKHLIWLCWEEKLKEEAREIVANMADSMEKPDWQEATILFALDAILPPEIPEMEKDKWLTKTSQESRLCKKRDFCRQPGVAF